MTNSAQPRSVIDREPNTGAARGMFDALVSASCKAVEGVIAVDMAIMGRAWSVANGYVALGQQTMQSKSMNDLVDLYVAQAHARVESAAADTREIVELARQKLSETYAPVKEAFEARRAQGSTHGVAS